jgi:glycosyltransferase involved in cell wall biosynthesis
MRIALITSNYLPTIGGVENHVAALADSLVSMGHQADVFAPRPAGYFEQGTDQTTRSAVRVVRYSAAIQRTGFGIPVGLVSGLRRAAAHYDVFHVHNYHGLAAAVPAVLGLRPLCFTPHYHGRGHSTVARLLHPPYRPIGRTVFRHAETVICVSQAEARLVTRDFPEVASKIVVIPNGVHRDDITSALPYATDGPFVLVASRLEPHKRIDRVISAFAHLPANYQLLIIGDGHARDALTAIAGSSAAASRIRFLGSVDRTILYRWLNTADVVMTLSDAEAFGLIAAEGLAAGATVVASDIPSHRELAAAIDPPRMRLVSANAPPASVAEIVLSMPRREEHRVAVRGVWSWTDVAEATYDTYASRVGRA